VSILGHGRDHYRNMCGLGDYKEQRYTYYPDLHREFENRVQIGMYYGICVGVCPAQGDTIDDYGEAMREPHWFASHPTFNMMGRCVPYEPEPTYSGELEMCAHPACDVGTSNDEPPTDMKQVCGLRRDGTNTFWLLAKRRRSHQGRMACRGLRRRSDRRKD